MSRVVLVTARWGESHGESGVVVRLLAGALSVRAQVEVVSLRISGASLAPGAPVRTRRDSVFVVHEAAASRAGRAQAGLLRAALALSRGGRLPEISGPRLVELYGG